MWKEIVELKPEVYQETAEGEVIQVDDDSCPEDWQD